MAKSNAISGDATLLDSPGEPFYRPSAVQEGEARPRPSRSDSEGNPSEPFLRARRRVPVRRGLLPPWAKTRWGMAVVALGVVVCAAAAAATILTVRHFAEQDARFRIDSAACIQTIGNTQLSRADLLSVFGSDIGRNVFFVPLARRRADLEQLPWAEKATVMRVLPDQLRVAIVERTPVAFVQISGRIELADAAGVILDMSPAQMAARHYGFPVLAGINPGDPLSVRGARMRIYQRFLTELDSSGQHFSSQVSEIDLSDPEDLRATVADGSTDLLLDFGTDNFLPRWQNYQQHIAQWRGQYPNLASVDLRYEHEVVLKMSGTTPAASDSGTAETPGPAQAPVPAKAAHRDLHPARHKQHAAHHTRGAR